MKITPEMGKLRIWLDHAGIAWWDKSSFLPFKVFRTHFIINGYLCSVIHGVGTAGGIVPYPYRDDGLLEMHMLSTMHTYHKITAAEAICKIKEAMAHGS